MPHQCTSCDYLFEDGSEAMLDGCPDCGGNKFQFRPVGWSPEDTEQTTQPQQAETDTGRDTHESGDDEIIEAGTEGESPAQQSARSDVVSPSDMPNVSAWPDEQGTDHTTEHAGTESDGDRPPEDPYEREAWEEEQKSEMGLDALRQELNKQFESIKIMAPGEYELNLMELYEREEYIIALQEDGQYMIEVPNYIDENE